MSKFIIIIAILSICVKNGLCDALICYNCDPSSNITECKYPAQYGVFSGICRPQINTTELCISAYIEHQNVSKTGIYRKCINKPLEVENACDWIIENDNNTYKSCFTCNENRCNTILFNDDGTNSAGSKYNLALLMIINILFAVILSH